MLASPTRLTRTTEPVEKTKPQTPPAAPPVEAPPTRVLITTQQVAFSTAAALRPHRENVGARLVATVRRMFAASAASTDASHPRSQFCPRRYQFLENALMAREMDRL